MKTKLFLRLAAAVVALPMMFASCGDDNSGLGDLLGNIPGLGNAGGEPTGTPFKLPEGVTLVEGIEGVADDIPDYWGSGNNDYSAAAKPDGSLPVQRAPRNLQTRADEATWLWRGSGYGYVDLLVRLKNDTSSPQTITFPAALIVKSVSGASQHGVLIKKATVSVPAGGQTNVVLSLYCGNLFKSSAHGGDEYEWGVVSDSRALLELCELVKNKKINIEEFEPNNSTHYLTYSDQTSELQDIVWNVTDLGGLTDENREYIAGLPNS